MMRETKLAETLAVLTKRYPTYSELPNGERVLLAASVLVNDFKVEEVGNNAGPWVAAFLAGVNLPTGYPWCAAFIEFCCDVAGASWGPGDRQSAAVINWRNTARTADRVRTKAARGRLCYFVNANGTGHMGIVAGIQTDGRIISYEGNTSPGDEGSQRDGQGAYRRVRKPSVWHGYIELDYHSDA